MHILHTAPLEPFRQPQRHIPALHLCSQKCIHDLSLKSSIAPAYHVCHTDSCRHAHTCGNLQRTQVLGLSDESQWPRTQHLTNESVASAFAKKFTCAGTCMFSPGKVLPKALVQLHDAIVVQMVIVVVANDHKVDVGKLWIIQLQSWLNHSPARCILK